MPAARSASIATRSPCGVGTSPLPLPTTRQCILVGGWEGERASFRVPRGKLRKPASHRARGEKDGSARQNLIPNPDPYPSLPPVPFVQPHQLVVIAIRRIFGMEHGGERFFAGEPARRGRDEIAFGHGGEIFGVEAAAAADRALHIA